MMTTEEVLADLTDRIEKGIATLDEMAAQAHQDYVEVESDAGRAVLLLKEKRLEAKASGMAVALDYLRSY